MIAVDSTYSSIIISVSLQISNMMLLSSLAQQHLFYPLFIIILIDRSNAVLSPLTKATLNVAVLFLQTKISFNNYLFLCRFTVSSLNLGAGGVAVSCRATLPDGLVSSDCV